MARTLVYSDGFDYALASDLSAAASWELNRSDGTQANDFEVRDSDIRNWTNGTRSVVQVAGQTFSADQYAKITISSGTLNTTNGGLALRCQTPSTSENCYRLTLDGFTAGTPDTIDIHIDKYDAGVSSTLSVVHTISVPTTPFTISFEAEGTSLRGYVNDTEIPEIAVTDSTFTSGVPGIQVFSQDSAQRWDSFESGDITASSATGSADHTAETATHDAAGVAGTLALSLDLVDSTGSPVADMSDITAVVYDAVGGTELHETATAATVGGTCVIEMPGGTADVGAEVFVTLHKAGASQQDDYNGCGRTTVTVS